MKLPSQGIQAFLSVTQHLHFGKAAQALGLTQSALSQRIFNLENSLETTLFIRDRTGVRLTPEGVEFFKLSKTLTEIESEYLQQRLSQNELAGTLSIATFSTFASPVLIPLLAPWLRQNPKVQLHLTVHEVRDLESKLKTGAAQMIITLKPIEGAGISCEKIGEEKNYLVESSQHRVPDVYLDHDQEDTTTLLWMKLNKIKSAQIKRHYLANIQNIFAAAERGTGKAVLPERLFIENRKLRIHPKNQSPLTLPIYLATLEQPYYPKVFREALRIIKNSSLWDKP